MQTDGMIALKQRQEFVTTKRQRIHAQWNVGNGTKVCIERSYEQKIGLIVLSFRDEVIAHVQNLADRGLVVVSSGTWFTIHIVVWDDNSDVCSTDMKGPPPPHNYVGHDYAGYNYHYVGHDYVRHNYARHKLCTL